MLELIGQALLSCLEPVNILTMFISVTIGIVIGALPGFGAATGLVLVLPLTYSIDPSTAFIALTGIYLGAEYGGSISSILINTPGTTAAVITAFDGYPLAQRGHAREALLLSNVASFSGGCFGGFMMLLCMPILGKFVLKFGAGEIFILAAIGLLLVGSIARGNMLKGIASAGLGLFFTLFGADSINGVSRFDFDVPILIGGLPLIGGMLGMFAVPQMINLALSAHIRQEKVEFGDCTISANFSMFRKCVAAIYPKMLGIVARSGLFGVLIGIVPGVGAAVASMAAYTSARKYSSHPEEFGKGAKEGIVAPEAANNALVGGSLIPVLSLGIPGSPAAAIYMGAIFLHGMTPGPNFLVKEADLVYLLIAAVFLCSFVQLFLGAVTIGSLASILKVSASRLFPVVITICCLGAFVSRGQDFDIAFFLVLGICAFFAIRLGFNMGAIVLGAFLGSTMEVSLLEGLTIAGAMGGIGPYLATRKIAMGMLLLVALYLAWQAWQFYRASRACSKKTGECKEKGSWRGYRGWDLAVSLAVIAAAAWFYGMARDYPETSRLFPQIVLLVIGGCMAINVVRCIFFGTLYAGIPAPFAGLNLKKAAVSVALLLGYLFCMNLLGFYASTALFFMAASFVLDLWQNPEIPVLRRLRGSLLYTVCAVPCLWLIFVKLFRVSMPEGILM
ncbi:MAG TPA: tripartite tricarboxylate transporter permease [Candidatus Mailhella excrementigallinarum]|nr:MAG: hypothetical protein DBY37_02240 [Desulfovibrionaceae bacterium]HIV66776.1 tripartite tricarboxylate transporter permease [Candidatus Mailhella excrementigallinarum]